MQLGRVLLALLIYAGRERRCLSSVNSWQELRILVVRLPWLAAGHPGRCSSAKGSWLHRRHWWTDTP